MSGISHLAPGGTVVYSTRPAGLKTNLFLRCSPDGDGMATWHISLCCKKDNDVPLKKEEPKKIDISAASGALVTVRNTGFVNVDVWTDY